MNTPKFLWDSFFITGHDRIFLFSVLQLFVFYHPYHCTSSVDWSWRTLTPLSKLLNTTTFPSSTPIKPPKPQPYYFVLIYFSHIWSESILCHLQNMVLLQKHIINYSLADLNYLASYREAKQSPTVLAHRPIWFIYIHLALLNSTEITLTEERYFQF